MERAERVGLGLLSAGWLAFLFVAYPGLFTQDSLDQLMEARGGVISDAHPPLMAIIWRYVDVVLPGTFGMLVLQTGLLLAGLYLVLRRVAEGPAAAAIALAIFWFPPINAPMMVIWKDSLMAGICMLAFALLLDARRAFWGIALLSIGCALRYNGLALAFPPIVLLFDWGRRWRYPAAVAVWLGVVVLNFAFAAALTERKTHYWSSSLALMDIAGTLCFDERHYSDAELEDMLAGTDLRVHTNIEARMCKLLGSGSYVRLISRDIGMWPTPESGTATTPRSRQIAAERAWKRIVPARPRAYFAYRLSVFYRVMSLRAPPWGMVTPVVPAVAINRPDKLAELELSLRCSPIQSAWVDASTWVAENTPLFRPWLYLLATLAMLAVTRRRSVVALLLSGIALEATLAFLTVSPDYRYSHWFVLSAVVGGVLIVLHRRQPVSTT